MAIDTRAYGAQVQAANQAYRARSGGYSPFAPAQPQQTLATNQVQPRQNTQNYNVTTMPAGYTPALGPVGAYAKRLLVNNNGVPMSNPVPIPAFGQGTNGQPGGGSVFPGMSPNQNMQGPNALPTQPWVDSPWAKAKAAIGQPPANPVVTPTTQPSFTGGGDWARNFFGSGMGGQYGTGNGMAKLQGWGVTNPEGVQRMRNTGLVPPADYYTRNR